MTAEIRVLVAAAGRGSRAGLPYPKTLFPLSGRPILLRILDLLVSYDRQPTVIASAQGEEPIRQALATAAIRAHVVVQPSFAGMGDAVLCFADSPAYGEADHLLLVWGDIPFLQAGTVKAVVDRHLRVGNDFTFASRVVDAAYTVVARDERGNVMSVIETREEGIDEPQPGERDIGLFVFRKDVVFPLLREELPRKHGTKTGEHGFLYIIEHLVSRGFCVEALPVASELDVISLNSLDDVRAYL